MDRRTFLNALAAAGLASLAGPAFAQAANPAARIAAQLRDRALTDPTAYDLLTSLTTEVGPRLAGTEASARARDWGLANLRRLGFANVRAEPFTVTSWVRGAESCVVTAPYPQPLQVLGLGRSISTPPGGVEAPIVVFPTYEGMLSQPPGSLAGKIAVVNQIMARSSDGSGYGAVNAARTRGASEASRRGAVAYLVRSLSSDPTSRLPHAGAMRYLDGVTQIPAAALAVTDADQLARMAAMGAPVRVRLTLASTSNPNATAWTVSGEITGSETPEQIIVIGGHLDSWDPGTGAIDDGAGIVITTGAANLIGRLPRRPKRTIRAVMWGAEEMDYSDDAYAAAHAGEAGRLVVAGESDSGADRVLSVQLPRNAFGNPAMAGLSEVLAAIQVFINPEAATRSGSDTGGIIAAGAAALSIRNDTTRYWDWHHSADDTLDKVDRDQLNHNVAVWAAVVYMLADSGIDFRATPAAEPRS